MGRVKEMMMDWDFGLMHAFDKDKYVCVKHFSDPYLNPTLTPKIIFKKF